jgi:hypothetical protein
VFLNTGSRGIFNTNAHTYSGSTVSASSKANVRNQSKLVIIKQRPWGAGMLPGPEVGGNGGM